MAQLQMSSLANWLNVEQDVDALGMTPECVVADLLIEQNSVQHNGKLVARTEHTLYFQLGNKALMRRMSVYGQNLNILAKVWGYETSDWIGKKFKIDCREKNKVIIPLT